MTKQELIETIFKKFKDAMSDPVVVAQTMFDTHIKKLNYDKYDRDAYVESTLSRTKMLVWYASQGFPNLIDRLEKTHSIELYAENNRKVEEIVVSYEEHYLNLFIDRGREQFYVPDFDFRKRPQSEIDAYEAVTAPVDEWWQQALIPVVEAWDKEVFKDKTKKSAEEAAQKAIEDHKMALEKRVATALTHWSLEAAAHQCVWDDYLRFRAAGGSTVDCREVARYWQSLGVEADEVLIEVLDVDATGTYINVRTCYPLTGAAKTEYLYRRCPEALPAAEAKTIWADWETEQVPRLAEIAAMNAAIAEEAETERLANIEIQINRNADSIAIGKNIAEQIMSALQLSTQLLPAPPTRSEATPDECLAQQEIWLKLANSRLSYVRKAVEQAATLEVVEPCFVEVEDEDNAPHNNPVTVVGNRMYSVNVPASYVGSCPADEDNDLEEEGYKIAGEVTDSYGDTHIVFYRPRRDDRRGQRANWAGQIPPVLVVGWR